MRSVRRFISGIAIMSCVLAPSVAAAQPSDQWSRLADVVSGAFRDGGPAPSFDLSAGYRFTSRLGLEIKGSYLGGLDFGDFPNCPPDVFCILGGAYSLHARARSR